MATDSNTREIPLTQGKVALVDAADYDWLMQWKWHARPCKIGFYAARSARRADGIQYDIRMHRLIVSAPQGSTVDHANHDGLDNRRSNLRVCTLSENARNTHSRKGSSSPYLGVSWASRDSKWRTQISLNGRKINVGYFDDEMAAARAYDAAARKHFREYANPNFKD